MILALLCLTAAAPAADPPADKLVGKWVWRARAGDFDQHWVVRRDGDKWAVEGRYTAKDGTEAGSFVGTGVKYVDGALTYVHRYVKKPTPRLKDNVPATLRADGDVLSYTWDDPPKGPRLLLRETESAAKPDPAAKPAPPKTERFVGTWQGSTDGYTVVWTVKHDAEWAVQGTYGRGGSQSGSFVGVDVKVTDDTMTFTRKFVKKPSTDWQDNQAVSARVSGDGLVYTVGNAERAMRRLTDQPAGKPDDKAESLVGTWEGEVQGLRVVWQVAHKDGKWQVGCVYYAVKGGTATPVGAFDGAEPVYRDGRLTFSPKYSKKPRADWFVVDTVVARSDGTNTLKYTTEDKGRQVSATTLTRVKK